MDATILLLWIVILLILHLLVEKSLQMKIIAESFMNTHNMRTRTSLEQDINNISVCKQSKVLEEQSMESDLLNFLMNGDPALSKQMQESADPSTLTMPVSGQFNLQNHTNILSNNTRVNDERYQLTSGKFANLNTFDSIVSETGTEQFSAPMQ